MHDTMKIAIGADHGAFERKAEVIEHLRRSGHEVKDFGTYTPDSCDYPEIERIVQMDCDFSHNPADVLRLLQEDSDLVIASRYVKGGGTPGWPFKRRLISRMGGIFIRAVTGMPVKDPTGGFKCWKVSALKAMDFLSIESAGYSFQLEMNHRAWKASLSISEIPILFTDRTRGYSKISARIAVESLKVALKLGFSK